MRDQLGAVTPIGVIESTPNKLILRLSAEKERGDMKITVIVEPDAPNRIVAVLAEIG